MKKLDINNTRKQYNIMLNAYTKAEETRFNVHCFHIHLVATNELTSKEFEEHITDAISGMNDLPKDNTLLNSSQVNRFKSLNCNPRLLEQLKKATKVYSVENVAKFLKDYANVTNVRTLEIACYNGGAFSTKVVEKDAKKLLAKKKASKKPSGKTNQSNNSKNNVKINAEEIEKSILQIVKFAEKLASNKETRSYLKAMNDLNDAVYNGKNELYSILLNKFKKSGIKA